MKEPVEITSRTRVIEIIFVVLTGFAKIAMMDIMDLKLPFIVAIILFWSVYVLLRTTNQKGLLFYWGLSLSNSGELFKRSLPIALILMASLIFYGLYIKPIHWSIHILFVLIIYPIWGLIQQFLMMSLFAGNLMDLSNKRNNNLVILLCTSILFSMVHYPSWPLMAVTFFMALIYAALFLRYRNIIPLGVFHGILGGLFYFIILGRDAWIEFVAKYVK